MLSLESWNFPPDGSRNLHMCITALVPLLIDINSY